MELKEQKSNSSEESGKISYISLDLILRVFAGLIVVISLLIPIYIQPLPRGITVNTLLGVINGLLAFLLFVLYVLVNKLYRDIFYYLIGISWLLISFQVFFQVFFFVEELNSQYFIVIALLCLLSNIILYIASSLPHNSVPNILNLSSGLIIGIALTIPIFYFVTWLASDRFYPYLNKGVIFIIAQVPISFWVLVKTGKGIYDRLQSSPARRAVILLTGSFITYGLLQLPPAISFWNASFISIFMLISLSMLVKIINVFSLFEIISAEFAIQQELLVKQSVFEDIGALTAGIEHEMRTPLGILNGQLHLMKQEYQHNADVLKHIDRIEEQKERIFHASQIVTFLHRKDEPLQQNLMKAVAVNDLIHRSIDMTKRTINTSNIYFRFNSTKNIHVNIFPSMMEQVLLNILKNAVEAIQEAKQISGVINIEINSGIQSPQSTVVINITDNGPGISEDDIPKIKTIYSTKKNKQQNKGIGLFIAERIINLHKGQLEIKSTLGEGTSVLITLPRLIQNKTKLSQ